MRRAPSREGPSGGNWTNTPLHKQELGFYIRYSTYGMAPWRELGLRMSGVVGGKSGLRAHRSTHRHWKSLRTCSLLGAKLWYPGVAGFVENPNHAVKTPQECLTVWKMVSIFAYECLVKTRLLRQILSRRNIQLSASVKRTQQLWHLNVQCVSKTQKGI